jgi:hypothetical protein
VRLSSKRTSSVVCSLGMYTDLGKKFSLLFFQP